MEQMRNMQAELLKASLPLP